MSTTSSTRLSSTSCPAKRWRRGSIRTSSATFISASTWASRGALPGPNSPGDPDKFLLWTPDAATVQRYSVLIPETVKGEATAQHGGSSATRGGEPWKCARGSGFRTARCGGAKCDVARCRQRPPSRVGDLHARATGARLELADRDMPDSARPIALAKRAGFRMAGPLALWVRPSRTRH